MSGIAILLISLFFSLVSAANPRPGFAVGTSSRLQDIVKDGVVQPGWGTNTPGGRYPVPIGNFQLTWFIHLNSTTIGNAPTSQYYNTSWVTSDPPVGSDPSYTLSGTGLNDTITLGYPDRTDFIFTCQTDATTGWSTITISVRPYDDIVIFVQHMCVRATTFNMGLGKFDVSPNAIAIQDGEPRQGFTYSAESGDDFTQFYAWLSTDSSPFQQYSVTVTPAAGFESKLTVDVTNMAGWLAYYQFDETQNPSTYTIFWNCLTHDIDNIDVLVDVFTGSHHHLQFHLNKVCNKPLTINPGFFVGLEKNGTEVVKGSVATPEYSQLTPYAYVAGDITTTFWLWLDGSLSPAGSLDYIVQVTPTAGFMLSGTGFSGTVKIPTDGPERDTTLTVQMQCYLNVNVSYTILITFPNNGQFAPVSIFFTKPCVDPQLDIGQYEITGGGTVLVPTFVHKNVVNPNMTFIDDDRDHSSIYIWIPKSYSLITPYQQFQITGFSFNLAFMDATLTMRKGDKARSSTNPAGTPYLLITYRCVTPPDISESVLNVTINYGWGQPLTFSWIKRCDSSIEPTGGGGDSSSSAWSPFGIFAFTVFILILVWCLVGCGYNYVAKDQRGADAIPGINLYRSIYYKCFPSPKYTPQTDYNYSEKEAPDYGGTSYQSENL